MVVRDYILMTLLLPMPNANSLLHKYISVSIAFALKNVKP